MAAANIAAAFSFRCVATHTRDEFIAKTDERCEQREQPRAPALQRAKALRVGRYSCMQVLALDCVFPAAYFPRLHNNAPLKRGVMHRAPLSAVAR